MNKEKFMQLMSDAFDNGSYISIHFPHIEFLIDETHYVTKEEQETRLQLAKEALGQTVIGESSDKIADSFVIEKDNIRFNFSYNRFMKEDINFDGDDHAA